MPMEFCLVKRGVSNCITQVLWNFQNLLNYFFHISFIFLEI